MSTFLAIAYALLCLSLLITGAWWLASNDPLLQSEGARSPLVEPAE